MQKITIKGEIKMKIVLDIGNLDKIQLNIDAVEKAIITPQVGVDESILLTGVKDILIAIKEAAEAKGE